ncbi:MAG TPA: penicillin-binding transpeptidase domain-containing protein [Acidimicrobiales bacterium]|nr:penicillin-binding transpeptidase domain-containing protein [Acidimicrobiales bacterium]
MPGPEAGDTTSPASRGRRRRRPRRALLASGLVVVLGAVVSSCGGGPDPGPAAARFLSAWSRGDLVGAAALTGDRRRAQSDLESTWARLEVMKADFRLGAVHHDGDQATAAYRASLQLAGLGDWRYDGRLALHLSDNTWQVSWSPSDIHPDLGPGDRLERERSLPPRATIFDGTGTPLVTPQPVVVVGLVPSAVKDLTGVTTTLQATTGADAKRVRAAVAAARPDEFVPVITLRQADYEKVKPQLYPLPGVRFEQSTGYLAPTSTFAAAVLGRVGPATAEALKNAGPEFEATDEVGLSGLELLYQSRLAGTPSGSVFVQTSKGQRAKTLYRVTGHPGQSVTVTLDPHLQSAAEAALSTVSQPAALVAVAASTGDVVAAASTPADSSLDRALDGRYPPGSSFKVVTATALLATGVTPDTPVPCPPSTVVDGKKFVNFEGETSGPVPFSEDFARSCNTAFVNLAAGLGPGSLLAAADIFGVAARLAIPIPYFNGSVPGPVDQAELASDAIGQGRVLVSPLTMAMVAATVDAGSWHAPLLVADPPQQDVPPAPATLPPATQSALRDMMRAVVTGGTGTAANLPGVPVFGKTGTAEFGHDTPPQTHAWFIGFRGDLAFAVLVEGGGVGGQVAAPVAARFLASVG